MKNLIPILGLLSLVACGKNSQSAKSETTESEAIQSDGTFKVILRPLNFKASGWIPNGMADIKVKDNQIEVRAWMDDSADVTHKQNIHVGTRCPSVAQDTNKDGFIDWNESTKMVGEVLMALDDDLNSPNLETSLFPKGNYTYSESGQLVAMRKEIPLTVEGKVIIVTGTVADPNLPIACGVIERIPSNS